MMLWWNLSKQQNIWMMYPPGDRDTTDFAHLNMVILSIEEKGRGRGRGGRRRRNWLQERPMGRQNGGFSRGYGQDNNARAQQQAPTDRPQPTRQEDEWSLPPNVERGDDTER